MELKLTDSLAEARLQENLNLNWENLKSENILLNLITALKNEPDNFVLIAELAKSYMNDSEISEEAKNNALNSYARFWALEGKNLKST